MQLPFQPRVPTRPGVILPHGTGNHIVSSKGGYHVQQNPGHRLQIVNGVADTPAQAEDMGQVVAAHPQIENAGGDRLQFLLQPGQLLQPSGGSRHGVGLKNRHIEKLGGLGDVLYSCQIRLAVVCIEFGQDKAREHLGDAGQAGRHAAQVQGRANADENARQIEAVFRVQALNLFQGAKQRVLRLRQMGVVDRILQTEGQGKRRGNGIVQQRGHDGIVQARGTVQQSAHRICGKAVKHGNPPGRQSFSHCSTWGENCKIILACPAGSCPAGNRQSPVDALGLEYGHEV